MAVKRAQSPEQASEHVARQMLASLPHQEPAQAHHTVQMGLSLHV